MTFDFEHATQQSLINLIKDEIMENAQLEYKAELRIDTTSAKKEFLADVSSFANHEGGVIIYGLTENKGVASKLIGINTSNKDDLILSIESIIRDGIKPRINTFLIRDIPLENGNCAILIKIRKSHDHLHQVVYGESMKFYCRGNNGKFVMDAEQVLSHSNMINQTSLIINNLQISKLEAILAGNILAKLWHLPKIILQMFPISPIIEGVEFDLTSNSASDLPPLGGGNRSPIYNFDGVYADAVMPGATVSNAYIQIYNSGIIETVNSYFSGTQVERNVIYINTLESYISKYVSEYLAFYKKNGINSNIWIYLTLADINGYSLMSEKITPLINSKNISSSNLLRFSVIKTTDAGSATDEQLRKVYNKIWNAFGFSRSFNQ